MKRRVRSSHSGVVLLAPDKAARHGWRARWRSPDSGKMVKITLDANALRTAEARRDWAIRKAKALAKRRMELEAGATPATGTGLSAAIARYYEDNPQLRERTREVYRNATNKLVAWGSRNGVKSADDLDGPKLVAFRASLVKEPARAPVAGKGRGTKTKTEARRAPATVNIELRATRTVLGYCRRLGLLPRLTADGLADALKHLPVSTEAIEILKPAQLRKLLQAAVRHDSETFAATRDEHAGKGEPGSTPRHEAMAPYLSVLLLTGMRRDEARTLTWDQIDLDALDNTGARVGEIALRGDGTKTHRARIIALEVSPACKRLLAALKLAGGGRGAVFPKLSLGVVKTALVRLRAEYGAPEFSPQVLRQTAGSYLTNAPGIYGSASAYHSARQLGHSVAVAERSYLGRVRGIPPTATTLESAMQVEAQLERIIQAVGARPQQARKAGGR